MSVTILPNTGIMGDDRLDKLRGDALVEHHAATLPEPVVYYLRALEARYMDLRNEEKRRALREVGWSFPKEPA